MSTKVWNVGALLLAVLAVACQGGGASKAPASPEAAKTEAPFPLEEMTIEAMQDAMAKGTLTSHAITEQYLARIEALDRKGPALGSVIEINPDALAIADGLDKERKEKGARGPLHGVPVLIKDNIETADKMMTTAGSLALVGPAPAQDAFIVERLRAAGAVVLGKTNLSEWANFRSTRSVSGWSGRGGLVRNPYDLDRSACGSSSGTGAAIAANFAAVGVGTETDGSIICPSSTNGLVGIKPTVGLASRAGIVPISHTQDTPGPMARTVRDAALLLSAMAGVDPRDAATGASEGKVPADLVAGLDAGALKGKRIGVLRGSFAGYSPRSDQVLDAAEFEVLQYEFKTDLNAYLAGRPGMPVKTLADLIAFNNKNAEKEMPHFGQELFLDCEKKGPLTEAAYKEALAKARKLSREGIDQALKSQKLDALLALSGGPAWTVDLVNGDHFLGSSTSPAAVSGYPSITVPAGEVAGLPIGISLIGTAWSEPKLIQLAYAFEQATKARKVPPLK